jgi:hypothetical protein
VGVPLVLQLLLRMQRAGTAGQQQTTPGWPGGCPAWMHVLLLLLHGAWLEPAELLWGAQEQLSVQFLCGSSAVAWLWLGG